MKKLLLLTHFVFFIGYCFGQTPESLPKKITEKESLLLKDYPFTKSILSSPPTTPVRTAAEWEEVEYLVLTWDGSFSFILKQIVEVAILECKVLIISSNPSSVQSYLTSQGVSLTNVEFINRSWDSIWMRDYAGNTVYANDVEDRYLIDWIYNRPRPNDDQTPAAHASTLSVPLYETNSGTNDLVNTGGNFMSDGLGNAFASELILEENEAGNPYGVSTKTESQIDLIMDNYMGIDSYRKMTVLPYDDIHHIDMHMKLLDEETILVSKYPDGVADGPQIQTNIDYITTNFQSPFGTDYEIKWVDAPPSTSGLYPDSGGYYRTYTNAVFINKSIIVPIYRAEYDTAALDLYRELLPGYNVVGIDIDYSGQNLIALGGGIHCITHTIGVSDHLLIIHQHLKEVASHSGIDISAEIKHRTGIASAKVFWRVKGTTVFNEAIMTNSTGDNWSTNLTVPSTATEIEYYIWAEANSGKSLSRPIVAPDGFWTFIIDTSLNINEYATTITDLNPNPTNGIVNYTIKNNQDPFEILIYNTLGQLLQEEKVSINNNNGQLNINDALKGTLVIEFSGSFGKIYKKVIKL